MYVFVCVYVYVLVRDRETKRWRECESLWGMAEVEGRRGTWWAMGVKAGKVDRYQI